MNANLKSPLEIGFERGTSPKIFASVEELRDWAGAERQKWAGLRKPLVNNLKGINLGVQIDPFSNLKEEASNAISNPNQLTNVRNRIAENAVKDRIISESPRGRWILEIAQREPMRAAMLIGLWSPGVLEPNHLFSQDSDLPLRMRLFVRAALDADAFEAGEAPTGREAVSAAINDTLAKCERALAEQRSTTAELKTAREQHENDLQRLKADYLGQAEESAKSTKQTIEKLVEDSRKAFEEFRQHVLHEMAHTEPVAHWESKAKRHSRWATSYQIIFLATTIGFATAWITAFYLMATEQAIVDLIFDRGNQFSLRPILILGLPAVFVLWILRLLSRRMTIERALAEDSRERAVITRAMLALEKQGVTSPEQRVLMLQALTRPSSVTAADDSAPMSLLEALIRDPAKSGAR